MQTQKALKSHIELYVPVRLAISAAIRGPKKRPMRERETILPEDIALLFAIRIRV